MLRGGLCVDLNKHSSGLWFKNIYGQSKGIKQMLVEIFNH